MITSWIHVDLVRPMLHYPGPQFGRTPLMEACRRVSLDCVHVLLAAGAEFDVTDPVSCESGRRMTLVDRIHLYDFMSPCFRAERQIFVEAFRDDRFEFPEENYGLCRILLRAGFDQEPFIGYVLKRLQVSPRKRPMEWT